MSELIRRIRGAEPRVSASVAARERARLAAMDAVSSGPRGTSGPHRRRLPLALAGIGALAVAAVVVVALVVSLGADRSTQIVLPGDAASPAAHQADATSRKPGIAATITFRPVAGVSEDDAFTQMARVIRARATRHRVSVDVRRGDRDTALVTVSGTREPIVLMDLVAGSAVAAYDLDPLLLGSFGSFHGAVVRARELAPGVASRIFYLFRNGTKVRGPAPSAADIRRLTRTLPPESEVLGLPDGYAVLRSETPPAPGAPGGPRPVRFLLVRDAPSLTPLGVRGAGKSTLPRGGGFVVSKPVLLTPDGRDVWDRLLGDVASRAASLGRPQRIALTTNGTIRQIVTADATGRLDARSPTLEFPSIGGSSGVSSVIPTLNEVPEDGSIPALVWITDTFRVGPLPTVLGERVDPVPASVRRTLTLNRSERAELSSVRRALAVEGPDGEWSVWNYLLTSGTARGLVIGPRRDDGFGFACAPAPGIRDCGGTGPFQLFGVPAATRTLRFTGPSGTVRTAKAANGWAMVIGPRRDRRPPPTTSITAEALDANGRVLTRTTQRFSLP